MSDSLFVIANRAFNKDRKSSIAMYLASEQLQPPAEPPPLGGCKPEPQIFPAQQTFRFSMGGGTDF
jgi:hypothetical protein